MKKNKEYKNLFLEAIRNENRFAILDMLFKGPMCVNEISKRLKIEQTLLSHHLKCLLDCRFIDVNSDGRRRVYSINKDVSAMIASINDHIEKYGAYLNECGILKE